MPNPLLNLVEKYAGPNAVPRARRFVKSRRSSTDVAAHAYSHTGSKDAWSTHVSISISINIYININTSHRQPEGGKIFCRCYRHYRRLARGARRDF